MQILHICMSLYVLKLGSCHNSITSLNAMLLFFLDINECRAGTDGCEQTCVNDIGSYHCTCKRKYFLLPDGKSCSSKPWHKLLYI